MPSWTATSASARLPRSFSWRSTASNWKRMKRDWLTSRWPSHRAGQASSKSPSSFGRMPGEQASSHSKAPVSLHDSVAMSLSVMAAAYLNHSVQKYGSVDGKQCVGVASALAVTAINGDCLEADAGSRLLFRVNVPAHRAFFRKNSCG